MTDVPGVARAAVFPFSAVVGADDAKLALVLAAVDPRIGGVLLRGEKGSAKTTLARGLAALLPGAAPFVELPVGATEDRLIGSIDVGAALHAGEVRFQPGLLAAAHGGVLYVDEINLLPDHLVDALLDVAASGVNRIERDGVSHEHPARFVLVGSMNPEEGDLRPQLLDRFGLAVDVRASLAIADRVAGVQRRLAFDADPTTFAAAWATTEAEQAGRIATAVTARVDDDLLASIAGLCVALGVEGLRADLVIARAAAALAGVDGRDSATPDDVRRVAPLAVGHRQRRNPFDDAGLDRQRLDDALDDATRPPDPPAGPDDADETDQTGATDASAPPAEPRTDDATDPPPDRDAPAPPPSASDVDAAPVALLTASRSVADHSGRRSPAESPRGRAVGSRPPTGAPNGIAMAATARAAAARRAGDPDAAVVEVGDLREPVRVARTANLVILAVDTSGSMGAAQRVDAVRGAILGLLLDAYQRRDQVALVTFGGAGARVALKPTGSVEIARARLDRLETGGPTPLAAGLDAAAALARTASAGDTARRPLLVIITDGRATDAPDGTDPLAAAHAAADRIHRSQIDAVVIDAETGPTRLGLSATLAQHLGGRHLTLAELTGTAIEAAVRATISG